LRVGEGDLVGVDFLGSFVVVGGEAVVGNAEEVLLDVEFGRGVGEGALETVALGVLD
jgi:hypothetical protein